MANDDADWVADVRRWVRASMQPKPLGATPAQVTAPAPLGYEAADPRLQSRPWLDASQGGITTDRRPR